MAVTTDILRTWSHPRAMMRKLLAGGPREDRVIAYLMVACLLIAVAQWPRLSREAAGFDLPMGADAPDLQRTMIYTLFAWIVLAPLLLYAIAAISHLIARTFGGMGTFYGARLAMFWALLASTPLLLLHGLLAGFVGNTSGTQIVGAMWIGVFALIWVLSLIEVERPI